MAGALVTGSETKFGNQGEQIWTGKSHKAVWWNSYQSRWDGVIPKKENATNGDHYVTKDVGGTESYSLELDDRSSSRMSIYWDDAGKTLYAIGWHGTTSEYFEISYNSGTDTYSLDVGVERLGETATGMERDTDGEVHAGSIWKYANGDVWIALLTSGEGLKLNRRSGGSWNGSAVVLDSAINAGCTTLCEFDNAGKTNVYVFCAEDDTEVNAEFNAYFIDQDHATPFTASNWTEDTISAMDGESDNHCDSVRDASDNIYIVVKTGSASTGETLIGLFSRVPGGTYTSHEVYQKQSSSANDRTRPCVAWDSTNGKIYVAHSKADTSDLDAWYVTSNDDDLDTWASEVLLFNSSGKDFNNVRSPQGDSPITDVTGLMFVCAQDLDADTNDDDVWYNLLTIASVGAAAKRRRVGMGAGHGTRR